MQALMMALQTLGIGAVGGAIALWLQVPLAPLVGPAIAVFFASRKLPSLEVAAPLRGFTLLGLGVYIGSRFSPELIEQIPQWLPSLGLNALMTIVSWAACAWVLIKWLRIDAATAAFCAVPGGLLSVLECSSQSSADSNTVLFVQAMRVILGMLALPFGIHALGYPISASGVVQSVAIYAAGLDQVLYISVASLVAFICGRKLNIAAAELTGPMLATAILYATDVVNMTIPVWFVGACFVIFGTALGVSLPQLKWPQFLTLTRISLVVFLVLVSFTSIFAALAHFSLGLDFITSLLAFAPSGITEATSIAVALDMDTAYVAANNMLRLTLCSVAAPYILAHIKRRAHALNTQ